MDYKAYMGITTSSFLACLQQHTDLKNEESLDLMIMEGSETHSTLYVSDFAICPKASSIFVAVPLINLISCPPKLYPTKINILMPGPPK